MKNSNAKTRTETLRQLGQTPRPSAFRRRAAELLLLVVSVGLATLILIYDRPSGGFREFVIGEPAPRTLFAPFALNYVDEKATHASRAAKSEEVPFVLVAEPRVSEKITQTVDSFFAVLSSARQNPDSLTPFSAADLAFEIPEVSLKFLMQKPVLEEVRKNLELMLKHSLQLGIADEKQKEELLESGIRRVTVLSEDGKDEKMIATRDLLTPSTASQSVWPVLPQNVVKNREMKNTVLDLFNAAVMPNLSRDEAETQSRRKRAAAAVAEIQEKVKKDELVVQQGMLITAGEKETLDQIQKKMAEQKVLGKLLALGLLVLLAYGLGWIYLQHFEKKIFRSMRSLVLVQTVLLGALLASKGIALWPGSSAYLMPAALASLLLTLLVHNRLGFFSAVVMAVLAAPVAQFQPEVILMVLISGISGTLAARGIRKRVQFLKLGAAIGLSSFAVIFIYRIFREYPLIETLQVSALGLANGLLITMPLGFLLLPILESLFNRTTDITLLELSDLNHPLLKRMIVEAPGTYHHSLVVSTLAESACEAIGANSLLARVGCYFHDIGKIARAEFFTENQQNKYASKHEKLTPSMSYLVILNHVKDGIELGRQYKLREAILKFIPEHQGTGVVYYFYRKALEQAPPGVKVNPDDYRYPGPKPQSRETAVALLSDSTEAASRSLKEPSPESIRHLVRKIINDKFIDGQLDECDLTLRDLFKIQESFVHNLMAIFHTRIKYPIASELEQDRPDLFQEDQFEKFRMDLHRHKPEHGL